MRRLILTLTVLALSLVPTIMVADTAYAACMPDNTSQGQVAQGLGETGSDCSDQGVSHILAVAVSILGIVVGIAGVIMVVLGGFKYITSGGEAGKVANAKNTLLYALVGLAIAALAQFLVHFVLTQATKATCPNGQHISTKTAICIKN